VKYGIWDYANSQAAHIFKYCLLSHSIHVHWNQMAFCLSSILYCTSCIHVSCLVLIHNTCLIRLFVNLMYSIWTVTAHAQCSHYCGLDKQTVLTGTVFFSCSSPVPVLGHIWGKAGKLWSSPLQLEYSCTRLHGVLLKDKQFWPHYV